MVGQGEGAHGARACEPAGHEGPSASLAPMVRVRALREATHRPGAPERARRNRPWPLQAVLASSRGSKSYVHKKVGVCHPARLGLFSVTSPAWLLRGMGNPWVEFGKDVRRARPELELVGLTDAGAEAMDAREFALQVSLLGDPGGRPSSPASTRTSSARRASSGFVGSCTCGSTNGAASAARRSWRWR